MRAMRLVGLLLVLAMLVAGPLASAGPAAAEEGRQLVQTSGTLSQGCSWDYANFRWYPPEKYWFAQSWTGGTSWAIQNGQLYLIQNNGHAEWHMRDPVVMHSQTYVKLYPVSSYTPDLSQVTGWYEGRWAENGILHDPSPEAPPWWTGHLAGQGRGDFAGQAVLGTYAPTEWGNDPITGQRPGLCPGGQLPFTSGTLTMQFTGKP